jgi:hypothetical protein
LQVVWGSEIFESFVSQAHAKFGEKEGRHIETRIFQSVTKKLQQKESKFRTALMRSMDLRRVPRVFFAAPSAKSAAGPGQAEGAVNVWAKEEEERVKARDAWTEESGDNSESLFSGKDIKRRRSKQTTSMRPFSLSGEKDDDNDQIEEEENEVENKSRMPVDLWLMKPDGV